MLSATRDEYEPHRNMPVSVNHFIQYNYPKSLYLACKEQIKKIIYKMWTYLRQKVKINVLIDVIILLLYIL